MLVTTQHHVNDSDYVNALDPILSRVRRDISGAKKADGSTYCDKAPLSEARLIAHVSGNKTYGAYLMRPGATTTQIALFDFDSHKGASSWGEMQAAAEKVARAAEGVGLRPIPFRSSGGRGVHFIFLWDSDQDAYSVRRAMRDVLASAGFKEGANAGGIAAGCVEIFPKQDTASEFGHMFILPLGGKSVPLDAFEFETMPRESILDVDWTMSAPVPVIARSARAPIEIDDVPHELAQIKAWAEAIPNSGDETLPYENGPEGRDYLSLIIAIHRATGGSADGLLIAQSLASRAANYDPADVEKRWDSVSDRQGGITANTLAAAARHYGYGAPSDDDFEALPTEPNPRPTYQRDGNGKVLALVGNVVKALRSPTECGVRIARDEFRAQNMLDGRVATDEDVTELQMRLEARDFAKLSKEMVRDATYVVAYENRYDSAIEWSRSLGWDGVPRIEAFLIERFGAADTPYTRAVGRYMWTALAGRVLQPGIQADMVPTLVGPQGIGKTQGVKAIAPAPELFCELSFAERDVEASRKMRGRLVIEFGELRGMSAKDVESVKAFITRQTESFRDLYRNSMTEFQRRHLFIGTTNKDQFLSDDTGERRWLPVSVTFCDPPAIARDRDQLWAEGSVAFQQHGIAWQDAQRLACGEHEAFKLQDEWEPTVLAWMEESDAFGGVEPRTRDYLRTDEVLTGALHFETKAIRPGDTMRIAAILKKCGYVRDRIRVQGRKTWVYLRDQGGDLV